MASAPADYLIITPVPVSLPEERFPHNVEVSRLDTRPVKIELEFLNSLSEFEAEDVRKAPLWALVETSEPWGGATHQHAAEEVILEFIDALQIVTPVGWLGVIMSEKREGDRYRTDGIRRHEPFHATGWANIIGSHHVARETLATVFENLHAAFEQKIVRLQTPVQLLGLGMQSKNLHISLLLWTIALDALLVAHDSATFCARLCAFLGTDTFVFPEDSYGVRPRYTVGEIAPALYRLRSIVAHGNEIPLDYRENVKVELTDASVYGTDHLWKAQRRELYADCAVFLLCAVLRHILLHNDLMNIVGESSWDTYLDSRVNRKT